MTHALTYYSMLSPPFHQLEYFIRIQADRSFGGVITSTYSCSIRSCTVERPSCLTKTTIHFVAYQSHPNLISSNLLCYFPEAHIKVDGTSLGYDLPLTTTSASKDLGLWKCVDGLFEFIILACAS